MDREMARLVGLTATNLGEYPSDPEDVLQIALTRRDATLISAALPTLVTVFPEATFYALDLDKRMTELVEAQKPEWINPAYDGSEG